MVPMFILLSIIGTTSSSLVCIKFIGMVLPGDELTIKLLLACEMGILLLALKLPILEVKRLSKVQLKSLSQILSMSSLAKVLKNPAWVWTCTITLLLPMLFGRVLMPSACCLWILDCGDHKGQSKGKNDPLQWYERPGHSTMLHGYGL